MKYRATVALQILRKMFSELAPAVELWIHGTSFCGSIKLLALTTAGPALPESPTLLASPER
jgi:hypothetical protein